MKDHSEFLTNSLAPTETEVIRQLKHFKDVFEKIHLQSLKQENINQIDLVNNSRIALVEFIKFKKDILKKLLECSIIINVPPTFINHMINEAIEFYRLLAKEERTTLNNVLEQLRLHKIFLVDSSGHAKFIASSLDGIESNLEKNCFYYMDRFDSLFKKSYELSIMYDRTKPKPNIVNELSNEAIQLTKEFVGFLDLIKKLKSECKINTTGGLLPLVFEHMINEASYYIYQIEQLLAIESSNK